MDYITQYLSTIRERRVIPDVKPGYMKDLLPDTAPAEPEDWENIFNDIERIIMPGVSSYCDPSSYEQFQTLTEIQLPFSAHSNHYEILEDIARNEVFSPFFPRWFTGRVLICTPITPV